MTCAKQAPSTNDRHKLVEVSSSCCVEAGEFELAAEGYLNVEMYSEAAWNFRVAGKFSAAVDIVERHRGHLDPELVQSIKETASIVFVKSGDTEYVDIYSTIHRLLIPPILTPSQVGAKTIRISGRFHGFSGGQ